MYEDFDFQDGCCFPVISDRKEKLQQAILISLVFWKKKNPYLGFSDLNLNFWITFLIMTDCSKWKSVGFLLQNLGIQNKGHIVC